MPAYLQLTMLPLTLYNRFLLSLVYSGGGTKYRRVRRTWARRSGQARDQKGSKLYACTINISFVFYERRCSYFLRNNIHTLLFSSAFVLFRISVAFRCDEFNFRYRRLSFDINNLLDMCHGFGCVCLRCCNHHYKSIILWKFMSFNCVRCVEFA